MRLGQDTHKEVGKQPENCVTGAGSGQALNWAELKEAKYGNRKQRGPKQSGLVTIDLNQKNCPADDKML